MMNGYKILIILFSFLCSSASSQNVSLESKNTFFSIEDAENGTFTVSFSNGEKRYPPFQNHPVTLEVDSVYYNAFYERVEERDKQIIGHATIRINTDTEFSVADVYQALPSGIELHRTIEVLKAGNKKWFNSYFGLAEPANLKISDYEFFVPGIWYQDNKYLPANSLASDYDLDYYYFREDRLPLPLVMWREKESGNTLTIVHKDASPETFWGEFGRKRIIDQRINFGSMGFRQKDKMATVFMFPGSEGERTYISRENNENERWALRSHPVKKGFEQRYKLVFNFSNAMNYPDAVKESWRLAYQIYQPEPKVVDMQNVYKEVVKVFDSYWLDLHGTPGLPFSVYLPDGKPRAYNYQMGFIGFQLPNAYYLLRNGLEQNDTQRVAKGAASIDFWVKNSSTPSGLPKTWVDAHSDQDATWRDYPTYMRVAGDGMEGALNAWNIMRVHGIEKPEWLNFCKKFGDWLVQNQNSDGSYYIGYDWRTDKEIDDSKYTTTNVIRFLIRLYHATDHKKYLQAALKAGVFSKEAITEDYLYVGGVIDNPNVKDRESGQQALYAFMALYDLTGEEKWLEAAIQAADYTETFMYSYNVPMATGDTLTDFPKNKNTTGQTIIATGHSAVDNGLSFSSFQYYRLFLFTGDIHYRKVAEIMMYNSLQTMDLDGSMGYKHKALQTEAFKLTSPRGHSVRQWLPWNAAAVMDPIHRFRDAFDVYGIRELHAVPIEKQQELNKSYGKTLGIWSDEYLF